MLEILVLSSVLTVSFAWPQGESNITNVIQTPVNCAKNQEWINGMCKDVWRSGVPPEIISPWGNQDFGFGNVITVPPNCPPGQEYINGQCRDVWRDGGNLPNSIALNGLLAKLWSDHVRNLQQSYNRGVPPRGVANLRSQQLIQCPTGFKRDAAGNCRPTF